MSQQFTSIARLPIPIIPLSLLLFPSPIYNFPCCSLPLLLLHPLNVLPPSNSNTFPVICALALPLKNNTTPAKSEGFPIRPDGCRSSNVSIYLSTPKLVMRLGKTPGQIQLTIIFCGTSFDAWIFVRWMQAAFEGP